MIFRVIGSSLKVKRDPDKIESVGAIPTCRTNCSIHRRINVKITKAQFAYKDDILCARCANRNICRFGHLEEVEDMGKCDEFKRDWNVKLVRRKEIEK